MSKQDGQKSTASSTSASTRRSHGPSPFPRRAPLAHSQLQQQQRQSSSSSSPPSPAEASDSLAKKLTNLYTTNFEKRPIITLCITNCVLSTIGDAAAQLIPMLSAASDAAPIAWDVDRNLRFAMYGFSIGPLIEKWNRFLEYRFPLRPVAEVFERSASPDDGLAFAEQLRKQAEKEGFRVNVDRGDAQQGQQYAGKEKQSSTSHIVDPQTVAMPNTGQPGQISVAALFKRVGADQLIMAPIGLVIFISTMAILEGLEWDEIKDRYSKLYFPILITSWQIWPFVQYVNFRYLPLRYRVPFSASLGVLWTIFLSIKNANASSPMIKQD